MGNVNGSLQESSKKCWRASKKGFTYSFTFTDSHQFKLDRVKNFLSSVNNPKTTKDDAKFFLKNDIGYETLKIIKTNPSSQISEKKNYFECL